MEILCKIPAGRLSDNEKKVLKANFRKGYQKRSKKRVTKLCVKLTSLEKFFSSI
jgi:hypothetical protein